MRRYNVEVFDISIRRWSYFGVVEATDEETAISLGWEQVKALDLDSKSTIKNLRAEQIRVIVCPNCQTRVRNVQFDNGSIGGVYTVTGARGGRVGFSCPECKKEFAILNAELESNEEVRP
ncbi:MAG: hypothetical protein P1Q69_01955 [Candidatus Thorarchaeota archaeon]|nr:hypothetical protein [Candidatus Thorarchaeota archaeon]